MSDIPTKDLPRPWPFMVQTEDPEADAAESKYCECTFAQIADASDAQLYGQGTPPENIGPYTCHACGRPFA
jgi:hypothetical protein